MKKFLMYILACVFTMSLASCGGGGSNPSAAAKSCYDDVFAGDFKGAVEQMHFSQELTAEEKDQFAALLQGFWSTEYKSYEITGEEVAEDGKTAKVFMKITEEGKDEPKEETVKMVNVDGTWLVDSGK